MEDGADCVQGKEGVLEYRCYTFQNNMDDPLLSLGVVQLYIHCIILDCTSLGDWECRMVSSKRHTKVTAHPLDIFLEISLRALFSSSMVRLPLVTEDCFVMISLKTVGKSPEEL